MAVASAELEFETPPVLAAADLAPASLLQGPHFRVEDAVPTDGFLAAFTIHSDVGTFEARRPGMLALRVHEVGSHTEVAVETAKAAGRATADIFGYDDARRDLAKQLAVDPYTTNEVLYKRLDEVARAGFAGKLTITIAKSFIPGSIVLSAATTASDWVWDTPRGELEVMIDRKLGELGVAQDEVDLLLRHPSYTLSYLAMLLAALKDLEGVEGLSQTVGWALTADTYQDARFMVNSVLMLAEFHQAKTPIERVRVASPLVGQTGAGELVAMGPVDYLSWTEGAFVFARRTDLAAAQRSLWLTGRASPRAQEELAKAGWTLHQQVLAKALAETTREQATEDQ